MCRRAVSERRASDFGVRADIRPNFAALMRFPRFAKGEHARQYGARCADLPQFLQTLGGRDGMTVLSRTYYLKMTPIRLEFSVQ